MIDNIDGGRGARDRGFILKSLQWAVVTQTLPIQQ